MVKEIKEGVELLFDPYGNKNQGRASIKTEHSHEQGREVRQNLLLPG